MNLVTTNRGLSLGLYRHLSWDVCKEKRMQVYICTGHGKEYLGTFTTREIAEDSWRITHPSLGYKLRFIPDPKQPQSTVVQLGSAMCWAFVGRILEVVPMERSDHL